MSVPLDQFWTNTMDENNLLLEARSSELERESYYKRRIEFAIYNTCFAGMNGDQPFKKIKKPQDLYLLPSEQVKSVPKFNGKFRPDLAEAARKGKRQIN